jgi:hypothetical protein
MDPKRMSMFEVKTNEQKYLDKQENEKDISEKIRPRRKKKKKIDPKRMSMFEAKTEE